MKFGKEDQIKEYLGRTKDGKVVTLTPGQTPRQTTGQTPGKLRGNLLVISLFFIATNLKP